MVFATTMPSQMLPPLTFSIIDEDLREDLREEEALAMNKLSWASIRTCSLQADNLRVERKLLGKSVLLRGSKKLDFRRIRRLMLLLSVSSSMSSSSAPVAWLVADSMDCVWTMSGVLSDSFRSTTMEATESFLRSWLRDGGSFFIVILRICV